MKNRYAIYAINLILCSFITVQFHSIQSADFNITKAGDQLIDEIINNIDKLKPNQEEIEEVSSPAIQKEQIKNIINSCKKLDLFIKKLPKKSQELWTNKQEKILNESKTLLKNELHSSITQQVINASGEINTIVFNSIKAGVTSAAIGIVMQAARIGTGNLLTLDTNQLLLTGLTATAQAALSTLYTTQNPVRKLFISSIATQTLAESALIPYVYSSNHNYQLILPSVSGPLIRWLSSEATAIITTMITDNNGIIHNTLSNANIKQALIGKPLSIDPIVSQVAPHIQKIISNQKIAIALTEVAWVTCKSSAIGAILYSLGLGYGESSAFESIGYAALTGIAQGAITTICAITNKTEPGALISIPAAPMAQQLFNIANATPAAALSATIQATVIASTNVIIDQIQKTGGFFNFLKKGKDALGNAIEVRWPGLLSSVAEGFATLQEIDPIPL